MREDGNKLAMTAQGAKQRIRYIDYYKAVSIILVVLAHINFANQSIKAWICGFNMPAFFFASGLLLKTDRDISLRESAGFVWKKVLSLMLPFFLWAMVYSSLSISNVAKILYGSHRMLASSGSLTSLWFLPALLISLVFFAVARFLSRGKLNWIVKIVLIALSFAVAEVLPKSKLGYPWCFDVSFSAFGFLLLGNLCFPMIEKVHKALSERKTGVLLCALAVLITFAGTLVYRLNLPYADGNVLMAEARYGSMLLFLAAAFLGILLTTAFALLLDLLLKPENRFPGRLLTFIGENTIAIFVVQKPIIRLFGKLFSIVQVSDAVALTVTCIGTTAACCLIALFLNRYLPALLGKIPQKPGTDGEAVRNSK